MWTLQSVSRTLSDQATYHFLSALLATKDHTFLGTRPDGTPVPSERHLFPGNLNLPFRRDFLAPLDGNQAGLWLRSQYNQDVTNGNCPQESHPEIQPSFFLKENIDLLRHEFVCGAEFTPDDLRSGSTILVWLRSLSTFPNKLFPSNGPTVDDAKTLLANIFWFLELAVADFTPPTANTAHDPEASGFHQSLLYEALKNLSFYLQGRHLQTEWNATPSSRRRYFWIFANMLHQLVALFDRWRRQDAIVTPLIPSQQPSQRLAGLSIDIYDRHSGTSTSVVAEVHQWRIEAQAVFSPRQYASHYRLHQEPPVEFFDNQSPTDYRPPYASFAQAPPPPIHQQRAVTPQHHHRQPPPQPHYHQAPPPPPPPRHNGPAPRPDPRPNAPPAPAAPAISASKFLLQFAETASPELRSVQAAVDFMRHVGGKAPVLHTKNIGPHKSDRQLCLAFCFQAAPFTGCRGHRNGRACHRLHLDCSHPDALPPASLAPLVAWLRSDTVRAIIVPTQAFTQTTWWTNNA
jgi:hypothetical protein